MKKFIIFLLIFVIFIYGCQNSYKIKDEITSQQSAKTLSDMQATACNTANDAGTCDTRLQELGIVSKEDCCQNLKKCC